MRENLTRQFNKLTDKVCTTTLNYDRIRDKSLMCLMGHNQLSVETFGHGDSRIVKQKFSIYTKREYVQKKSGARAITALCTYIT